MMRRALVGHTGFVGSNLAAHGDYASLFNSANIQEMAGQSFDEVTCAGISAVKWLANKEPEQDWAGIQGLLDVLGTVRARRFVLISTIDVYPRPDQPLDESAELEHRPNHPYGQHRLAVERWVETRFAEHAIVRLPALFGPNLKKNALFDLIHGHEVHKINPAGSFQWYPVSRLPQDLETVRRAGLRLVNLFTEPVAMGRIVEAFFPGSPVGLPASPAPSYRLITGHAELFGGRDGYVMDAAAVMDAMGAYVASVRGQHAARAAS